jgi:hypothetical protein
MAKSDGTGSAYHKLLETLGAANIQAEFGFSRFWPVHRSIRSTTLGGSRCWAYLER